MDDGRPERNAKNPSGTLPYRTWLTPAGEVKPQHKDDVKNLLRQIRSRGGTPDVMVTNYSMLEYMLVRPLNTDFERYGLCGSRKRTTGCCW